MTNSANKKTSEDITQEEKTKLEMKEQMLLQLHQQYAVNNNAKLSSAVTLIAALIAVIGAYGYVFLHINEGSFVPCLKPEFNLLGVVLTATAAIIVLAIMKHICMYQGFAQRRDQFIIYAIRCKYYLKIKPDDGNRIFPDNYHPFGKKGIKMYQGMFGEFIKIFTAIQLVIIISTYILCCNCKINNLDKNISLFVVLLLVFIICWRFSIYQQDKNIKKYEELCKSYTLDIDDENQNNDKPIKGYYDIKLLEAIIKCCY